MVRRLPATRPLDRGPSAPTVVRRSKTARDAQRCLERQVTKTLYGPRVATKLAASARPGIPLRVSRFAPWDDDRHQTGQRDGAGVVPVGGRSVSAPEQRAVCSHGVDHPRNYTAAHGGCEVRTKIRN